MPGQMEQIAWPKILDAISALREINIMFYGMLMRNKVIDP